MAKSSTAHVCQSCGAAHAKWSGRCEACGAWNTLVEETVSAPGGLAAPAGGSKTRIANVDFSPLWSSDPPPPRLSTGIGELDRVFGGSVSELVAYLLKNENVSADELREIRRIVNDRSRK